MIDEARTAAELGPAGIQPPSTMTPILPTPTPPPPGDGKGKADRSGGNGKKKSDG